MTHDTQVRQAWLRYKQAICLYKIRHCQKDKTKARHTIKWMAYEIELLSINQGAITPH